ncbi:MAG TPA: fumarylacetoacetate hydrolase family protein, partial [Nocardioides sp.]
IPRNSTKTDWEVELGVVIGKRASYLDSPDQSLEHVAGFVVANDLSEREFQLEISGGQWSKGKIAPGFSPIGPWVVTPDEVEHQKLAMRSFVNGEPRQDSVTADQIFDVATVIHHLSQFMVLDPGDLIMTGTPEGVALSGRFPYIQPGDVVEIEIDGLGRQRQEYVAFGTQS